MAASISRIENRLVDCFLHAIFIVYVVNLSPLIKLKTQNLKASLQVIGLELFEAD